MNLQCLDIVPRKQPGETLSLNSLAVGSVISVTMSSLIMGNGNIRYICSARINFGTFLLDI